MAKKSVSRSRPWLTPSEVPPCRPGCIHQGRWNSNGDVYCAYIFNIGHPRPCPGGPDCTEYQKGPRQRPIADTEDWAGKEELEW